MLNYNVVDVDHPILDHEFLWSSCYNYNKGWRFTGGRKSTFLGSKVKLTAVLCENGKRWNKMWNINVVDHLTFDCKLSSDFKFLNLFSCYSEIKSKKYVLELKFQAGFFFVREQWEITKSKINQINKSCS